MLKFGGSSCLICDPEWVISCAKYFTRDICPENTESGFSCYKASKTKLRAKTHSTRKVLPEIDDMFSSQHKTLCEKLETMPAKANVYEHFARVHREDRHSHRSSCWNTSTLSGVHRHSNKHATGKIPKAQCAFKILMIHEVLQFALRIAFRCVLHRCGNLDIHRWKLY